MKQPVATGTTLYFVQEHLYYIPDHAGPVMEYVVTPGEVQDYPWPKYLKVHGKDPNGFLTPFYFQKSDLGKRLFYTREEAIQYAEAKTDSFENIWGWLGAPDIPLRRPWRSGEAG